VRIVGGRHRGRTLSAPPGRDVRPTTDRTREAVFNILAHSDLIELEGATVLDAFCGTGALGLEALSRGAASAVFMDVARASLEATRANVAMLGEGGRSTILRADAGKPPRAITPCSLWFLDPPYRKDFGPPALSALRRAGWAAPDTLVLLEEAEEISFTPPEGFLIVDRRCYGDTAIHFLRVKTETV